VYLELADVYDLGAEFFRWEMATAVAGSILGINPFDQPNVQAAKNMTESVLRQFESSGKLPDMEEPAFITELLDQAGAGDYLAIMAYIPQSPETDAALDGLRSRVMEKYGIATTMGYGPRFLHSTGQLHKGGLAFGLFLQITGEPVRDITIPGVSFTFGVLADAQALGDLQALRGSGRRAVRVDVGQDPGQGIRKMADEVG